MPKGTRSGASWKADGKTYSSRTGSSKVKEGRGAARRMVGDSNLKLLDESGPYTESVSPSSSDAKKKADKSAAAFNRKLKVEKGKKRALAAGKSRIKDDFSYAVEAVKKKKSTNQNDYE